MNANTQAQYFDSVMYARVYINEIKIIVPPKGAKYCAVNASIIDGADKKIYRTIDLIVKSDEAKKLLWKLRDKWPEDRCQRPVNCWIADINIGSPTHASFKKKDGDPGAVLKGRLINIRNLRIGSEDIVGKIDAAAPKSVLVAPCYVNQIDMKGVAKVAILDGKIGEHTSQNVNLTFADIDAFNVIAGHNLCPRGYQYRQTNAKIFGIIEVENFRAEGFKTDKGECKSCLRGELVNIRYLKANDTVIVSGKKAEVKAA